MGMVARTGSRSCKGGLAEPQQHLAVERLVQFVVLQLLAEAFHERRNVRLVEDAGEIEPLGFPMLDGLAHFQLVAAADHVVEGAEAELGHDFAHFLGDEAHEIDHVLGLAR